MHTERELLVKKIFPVLRRICAERFVAFTEVDLRWGITEEQAAEGKVLPICLEEIERSRPYFIGLLGERYGWIPDTVAPEVTAKEVWIQEHLNKKTSVTELEILHGVLNNPQMAHHAFFYFRDPAYATSRGKHFQSENEKSSAKLADLKNRIRKTNLPLVDPYSDPEALAEAVKEQFTALIDRLFPTEKVPDPLDQEASSHRCHARRKLVGYVDRPAHSRMLRAFTKASPDGVGFVVTGESGVGKTALLADLASSWLHQESTLVLEHYFGATPASTSVDGFLRRLFGELKRLASIPDEIPMSSVELREILPRWLAQTSGGKSIVLVLDALNQIQGDEGDRRLTWLPRFLPPHVRVVASCLPSPALDTLRQRGWKHHELPMADWAERGQMIDSFLNIYHKDLGSKLRAKIIEANGSANPLFLRTVLEELRQYGRFERLPEQVRRYLYADTPQELFRQVIRRWQEDFHAGRDLVRRSLGCLWAAREGLGDTEWLDLLADSHGPMDRQTWRPLLLAMEPHLVQRGRLWAFGHDYLRQAVAAELHSTEDDCRNAHRVLADYFQEQLPSQRKVKELLWQLREAGEPERLRSQLLDIPLFRLAHKIDRFELISYWIWLKQERTMGQLYIKEFDLWSALQTDARDVFHAANELGLFLHRSALFQEAEMLYRRALHIYEKNIGTDPLLEAQQLNNLAGLLQSTSRFEEAEPLMRRALAIDEASLKSNHPVVARDLNNLAQLLHSTNRLVEAEPMMRRALEIDEACFGSADRRVARNLTNLAQLLQGTNRLWEAEPLIRRALKIDEACFGPNHPEVAADLNNLAGFLQAANRLDEAEQLFRKALEIDKASFGAENPIVARDLNNLAAILHATNRMTEAEPLMRLALRIDEASFGSTHPNVSRDLNNLGQLLQTTNRFAEAERLMRLALEIDETIFGSEHPNVARDLNNLALLLQATNRPYEAECLFRRALAIDEASFNGQHPSIARDLSNLGQLQFLQAIKRLRDAERLFMRALEMNEVSLGAEHPEVAVVLNNLGQLLQATNRLVEAEPLMRRTLSIDQASYGAQHPIFARDLNNLALLLQATNRYDEAEPMFRQALAINEAGLDPYHTNVAINLYNLALLLQDTSRLEEAEAIMRRALDIMLRFARQTGHSHPDSEMVLTNYIPMLDALGLRDTNIGYTMVEEMRRAIKLEVQ